MFYRFKIEVKMRLGYIFYSHTSRMSYFFFGLYNNVQRNLIYEIMIAADNATMFLRLMFHFKFWTTLFISIMFYITDIL